MSWDSIDAFFEAFNRSTEYESYRLRNLSRMMQDVPSRGERLSASSSLGAFTLVTDDAQDHPSHTGRVSDRSEERYSMEAAEELRKGVRSAGKGTKHRAPRPVSAPLVAYARLLGVVVA